MLLTQFSRVALKPLNLRNPSLRISQPVIRNMASTTGQKCEWLVILPDQEGALERRMKVRAQHLEKVMPAHESGFWIMGGAIMSEKPSDGNVPMIGSAMIAYAETKEEVIDVIKKDIYAESGVWDLSKIQIWPFRSAIRKGLHGGA